VSPSVDIMNVDRPRATRILAAPTHASAPTPLLRLLATKHEFVRTRLEAGKVPTAPMLKAFLEALVQELRPHVKAAPLTLQEFFKSGVTSLGWIIASNSPAPGSAPPQAEAVLGFLDSALAECAAKTGEFPVYGTALAESVAEELMTGRSMMNDGAIEHLSCDAHANMTGVGLKWDSEKNSYVMGMTLDGHFWTDISGRTCPRTWTKEEFVPWLAQQSDEMLHGNGNHGNPIHRGQILGWLGVGVVERLAASDPFLAEMQAEKEALQAAVSRQAKADARQRKQAKAAAHAAWIADAPRRAADAPRRAAEEAAAEEAAKAAKAAQQAQADKAQADREKKAAEEARVQAAKEEKAQQELAAALDTDDAALANMSKKDVIALIRKFASPESDLLMANARVLMSPASTKEQVVALWRQVKEAETS
jgi:hypothetical protein